MSACLSPCPGLSSSPAASPGGPLGWTCHCSQRACRVRPDSGAVGLACAVEGDPGDCFKEEIREEGRAREGQPWFAPWSLSATLP